MKDKAFRVVSLTDETANNKYYGKVGILKNIDYDCGCGQSKDDGMLLLLFPDGGKEEYWKEELKEVCFYCRGRGVREGNQHYKLMCGKCGGTGLK